MTLSFFVAGTDTEVGKTFISTALLRSAAAAGCTTVGLKPLAAGAEQHGERWQNEDAVALMAAASLALPYESVNPLLLKAPMAPHIAAQREGRRLSLAALTGYVRGAMMTAGADFCLVEGAGGWRVPLNSRETLADLPKALDLDVLLVVGMKLGCLNHALLSAEAIKRDGLRLRGWIANCLQPEMDGLEENIQTLQQMMPAPLVGVMPYLSAGTEPKENWVNPTLFRT